MADITFRLRPVAAQAVQAIVHGAAREVAIFGARGDRKTSSLFIATILHALEHVKQGHPLPVPWMSVRDTHVSHRLTTVRTLRSPWWSPLVWRIEQDEHVAVATVGGHDLVQVDLFGVEDQGAMDRLRMEVVGVHFEEVAPASVLIASRGVDESAWGIALTSQRIPSHCHPAVITTNYPDEDHWSWQRFVIRQHPGTRYFRIPPGEAASPEDRAEWERSLAGRPDLLKRLVAGEPGSIQLGDPVTPMYRESRHSASRPVTPVGPIYLGWDAWHHPAVVLSSLSGLGQLRVHLARRLDNSDVGTVAETIVLPWLTQHGLRDRELLHAMDPTAWTGDQSDRSQSAGRRIMQILGGRALPQLSNRWEDRRSAVNTALGRSLSTGEPQVLLCGPETRELGKALAGGWFLDKRGDAVKDGVEGQHSHIGDAMAYLCLAVFGTALASFRPERWALQTAYLQPHVGQPDGVSPAVQALERFPGFDPEAWRNQKAYT